MSEQFDLVVIGTGEAGGAPTAQCRQAGWTVAVVDDQPFGGTCAVRGCDPKKVLVGAADIVDWQRRMQGHGVNGAASIDWAELMLFKKSFTDVVPLNKETALANAGVVSIHGEARFAGEGRLLVGDRELHAKHIVLATGAAPRPLGIPGAEHVISSTQFLEMERLPGRIAFIGAGYISLEFAHVARAAGATVTIVGRGIPLPAFDEAVVARLLDTVRASGIVLRLDTEVTAVEQLKAPGGFRVETVSRGVRQRVEVDVVVHGAGRLPNTDRLSVHAGNIQVDGRGAVMVNEFLQSVTNERVYAAGDVTLPKGSMPLTPVAAHEGAIVASNLLGGNHTRPDYRGIPSVVFTGPPLSAVGLTESAARVQGLDIRVKGEDTTTWYANRRVRGSAGMYKTVIENGTDRILGAHLLGAHADEAINLFAFAVRFGVTAHDLKHMIYAYPTSGSDLPYMV